MQIYLLKVCTCAVAKWRQNISCCYTKSFQFPLVYRGRKVAIGICHAAHNFEAFERGNQGFKNGFFSTLCWGHQATQKFCPLNYFLKAENSQTHVEGSLAFTWVPPKNSSKLDFILDKLDKRLDAKKRLKLLYYDCM